MLTIDKDKRSPLPAYATQNFIGADFHNGQVFILQSHNDDQRSSVHNLRSPFDGFHNSRDQIRIFKEEWPLDQETLAKACRKTSKVRWEFFSRKDHAAARGKQADIELLQHPNVELEEWQHHSNLLWSGFLDWGICNIQDSDHVSNYFEEGYFEWYFTFWLTDLEKTAKWVVEHDCFRFGLLTARMVSNSGVNCLSFLFITTLLLLQTPLRKKENEIVPKYTPTEHRQQTCNAIVLWRSVR